MHTSTTMFYISNIKQVIIISLRCRRSLARVAGFSRLRALPNPYAPSNFAHLYALPHRANVSVNWHVPHASRIYEATISRLCMPLVSMHQPLLAHVQGLCVCCSMPSVSCCLAHPCTLSRPEPRRSANLP